MSITWVFSNFILNSTFNSLSKLSIGDNVPDVIIVLKIFCFITCENPNPGLKQNKFNVRIFLFVKFCIFFLFLFNK